MPSSSSVCPISAIIASMSGRPIAHAGVERVEAPGGVGTVNVREVPGYRLELTPFGGIKDSGLGYKDSVQEAMKRFTNLKTDSLPWPA